VFNAKSDDTSLAEGALAKLCQSYWAPVHSYISQSRRNRAGAEDLTQQFFARFLEKMQYRRAERERGRFRISLMTAAKNFIINEWERMSAHKRGGGRQLLRWRKPEPKRRRFESSRRTNARRKMLTNNVRRSAW
jgi:DNA-directed RNA polymerase specialized sigma24 family protein